MSPLLSLEWTKSYFATKWHSPCWPAIGTLKWRVCVCVKANCYYRSALLTVGGRTFEYWCVLRLCGSAVWPDICFWQFTTLGQEYSPLTATSDAWRCLGYFFGLAKSRILCHSSISSVSVLRSCTVLVTRGWEFGVVSCAYDTCLCLLLRLSFTNNLLSHLVFCYGILVFFSNPNLVIAISISWCAFWASEIIPSCGWSCFGRRFFSDFSPCSCARWCCRILPDNPWMFFRGIFGVSSVSALGTYRLEGCSFRRVVAV